EVERDRGAEQEDRQLGQEARITRYRGRGDRARGSGEERSAACVRARRRDRAVPSPAAPGVTWAGIALAALGLFVTAQVSPAAEKAAVTWHPAKPRVGDVAGVLVKDVLDGASSRARSAASPSRSLG